MKRKFIFSGIGIAVAIIAAIVAWHQYGSEKIAQSSELDLDFTYAEANLNLKGNLQSKGISMSSAITLKKQEDIHKYCTFLADEEKQKLIQYCTSTEIKDQSSKFLGNIHMIGSIKAPQLVIVALQSDPTLSNLQEVKSIFSVVTKELICDCWDKIKPGGYASIEDMVDAIRDFHIQGKKPDSSSNTIPLASKHFQMTLSTNEQGYSWKLLIAR